MNLRMTICAMVAVGFTAAVSPTNPLVQCQVLQDLTTQAQQNFPTTHDPLKGAERCSMSKSMSGTNTFHCAWPFEFRSEAATLKFNATVMALESCFDNPHQAPKDQTVNHPDSYDLRQYTLNGVSISLSLKDKGALQKTYVFLGIGAE